MEPQSPDNLQEKTLKELFQLADKTGDRRYHKLTQKDFADYRQFNDWRYRTGDYECGTTIESQKWVQDHSDRECPICDQRFSQRGGKTIDHKLPRAQYPWLSMNFENLWVICRDCNIQKAEMNWYRYEQYILMNHPDRYESVRLVRPIGLIKGLTRSNSEL